MPVEPGSERERLDDVRWIDGLWLARACLLAHKHTHTHVCGHADTQKHIHTQADTYTYTLCYADPLCRQKENDEVILQAHQALLTE